MTRKKRFLNPYGLETRALVLYHVLVVCLAIFTLDRIAAFRFQPAADATEIVLVASASCPHSRAVREHLVDLQIPFREIDSVSNPLSSALAAWTFQSLRVPIVVVGPDVIYGNRREQIDASLEELGYEVEASHRPSRSAAIEP